MTTLTLEQKWNNTLTDLNEAQRRRYLANEAKVLGHGAVSRISRATGISRETIHVGIREVESHVAIPEGRIRQVGGGRKNLANSMIQKSIPMIFGIW